MPENRQVVIASLPTGALAESDFELQTVGVPEPGPGQVLCRTLAVSVSAGSRAGLQGSASYAGAPKTGIVMSSLAVARVERSNDPALSPGDVVTCGAGWQDWSVHPAQQCFRVEGSADPARYLGVLGTNGLTAYFGLLEVGEPKPGDTVVVSAAAGSVGHLVGQIARIQGCRVVGVAGSDEKCQRLVAELGFDAAVSHRSPDFRQEFKAACGDGIDVYFDNTGGDVLGAALFRMRNGGRIACCGVVSQYDTSKPAPGPRGVPGLLVNKRLRMQGFLVFDWAQRYGEARAQLESWLDSGELVAWQDEFEGLESAPRALVDLLAGGNVGTRIVRVSPG
ncbi:MAG: NADP-dependent oxidoreductase [Deltaproteobacteria bacterium]|nr:NADP-dependent oxidoreductase [Deltaproteobacteria bacterium]MBW2415334.1 NADP-dependent oxidoreductase [Deltaproteobacteria bacterium]